MARIRALKPEAFTSESLSMVSLAAERTFLGLSTLADDRGRLRYQPAVLNGALWALRPEHTAEHLALDVGELVGEGSLCVYTGCDGRRYAHFPAWDSHQRPDRATVSRYPVCPVHGDEKSPNCPKHKTGPCPVVEQTTAAKPSVSPRPGNAPTPTSEGVLDEPSTSPRRALAPNLGSWIVDRGSGIVDLGAQREDSRPDGETPIPPDRRTPTQKIVEAYVLGAAASGQPDPEPVLRARVGKQASAMLQRNSLDVLLTAAHNAGAAGWHDLAVQVQRDAANARAPTQRASTTDARVAAGLALVEHFAALDAEGEP